MKIKFALLAILGLVLAGCNGQTTKEVTAQAKMNWIGQPVDNFFATYGPPRSYFPLDSGGTLYTWRGGEQKVRLPQNNFNKPNQASTINHGFSNSKTKVTHSGPGYQKSTTTSSSGSVSINMDNLMSIAATGKPIEPPTRLAYCEMQIAADEAGVITNINATTDTSGVGFSFSRCSEILN